MQLRADASADTFATHPTVTFRRYAFSTPMLACPYASANKIVSLSSTMPHLSKWPSDLKINGTQEIVTFSGPAFFGLPCGVLLFDASVSFKNHKMKAPDWLLKNSSHSEGGF